MSRYVLVVLAICLTALLAGAAFADDVAGDAVGAQAIQAAPTSDPAAVASAPGADAAKPALTVDDDYQLMEEDVLRMDVWGEPQLSNMQMQVTPDGKVNVPYLGDIQAAGRTMSELTADIKHGFENAGILINPEITITLITMHQHTVRVLGEVNRPGVVVFQEDDTVLDAIAQAGSYTDNAWLENATLTRRGSKEPISINIRDMIDGDLTNNLKLKKGDIISVPPEDYFNKIYVMGQVLRPGIYDLKENTTLLAAINLAGGPTDRASVKSTRVVRGDPKNPETVPCDVAKLLGEGDLSQDIALQPGDVVMVPETKQPNWAKWSQILSTILNFTYLRRFGF